MTGMLQILTWLLSFYLVMKGVEILQVGLASNRESRSLTILIGVVSLVLCLAAGGYFSYIQDQQAQSISSNMRPN